MNVPNVSQRFAVALAVLCALAFSGAGGCGVSEGAVPLDERSTAGRLVAAGAMSVPRAAHTATSLPDGRILVIGGMIGGENTATGAEIYEPGARSFVPTGSVRTPRHSHTATALTDGRILVVGGYGAQGNTLASAEVYDPQTRSFTATGALGTARSGQAAVLLPDGRVLVAGGLGSGWDFLATAELYDPDTGTFSPTGSMVLPRESHAAVRLSDGRVLIAGGHRGRGTNMTVYAESEIYDPRTKQFAATRPMAVRRHKHDAVLLPNGRVLVTGGSDERDRQGRYTSAEIFDPATGRFTPTADLRLPRYKHRGTSVVLGSGRVLLAGGAKQAEVYDPDTGSSTVLAADVPLAGHFSAATLLRGDRVLITGGYGTPENNQAKAWVYQP